MKKKAKASRKKTRIVVKEIKKVIDRLPTRMVVRQSGSRELGLFISPEQSAYILQILLKKHLEMIGCNSHGAFTLTLRGDYSFDG